MTRGVATARAAWGGGVLVVSRYLPVPRKMALALGFRHLAQAAAVLRRPEGVVARWGWTIDVTHSVSMLVLAAVSRRWRAAALANAVVAAGWARAARPRGEGGRRPRRRAAPPPEPDPAAHGRRRRRGSAGPARGAPAGPGTGPGAR
ncbi:hypothetical protein AB0J55_44830 [Amycolatopsis sp. NPDC049688]|uniref:hypothetical protein n=1 Tax=Amycolatopsis sp. NPDC049688 TaxID=3154733 RepID=UPI003434E09D